MAPEVTDIKKWLEPLKIPEDKQKLWANYAQSPMLPPIKNVFRTLDWSLVEKEMVDLEIKKRGTLV